MSIEQMAQSLLTAADDATLRSWTEVEDATFIAYASAYVDDTQLVCKGCHGG
ncbi:hypothetical protein [Nocardia seriolae]|uniref:Uncharacterized protein n=1 Tax=Nocardia seriolae TaxID=37332 RepID=A0ABC9Z493_9NOCA|nr:hypothetical protein [Nocardia seriolae]APA97828.1 hypothetical protein NS506_03779 [Nocardia seriolae]QOW36213.1 hypothetical protein IMZ23_15865 [Nocardia seriolae]QUN16280.1 hypothetical protein KEC46_29085 [Nocardia seriolae]WKY55118.1 hypothetical protein Q5P07_14475 [Nocardia seriolae]WNJ56666.1 hypothetical protein RMO66_24685 [Nocardia seriolae]